MARFAAAAPRGEDPVAWSPEQVRRARAPWMPHPDPRLTEVLTNRRRDPITVVVFGSSISAGSSNGFGDQRPAWPEILHEWLGRVYGADSRVFSSAVGGTGCAWLATNLHSVLRMFPRVDIVVVEYAMNDMLGLQSDSPRDVARATERVVLGVRHHCPHAAVLFLDLFPPDPQGALRVVNGTWAEVRWPLDPWDGYGTAQLFHDPVLRYHGVNRVSMRDALFPEYHRWRTDPTSPWHRRAWTAGDPQTNAWDHFHPNSVGQLRIARLLLAYFAALFACDPPGAPAAPAPPPPAPLFGAGDAPAALAPHFQLDFKGESGGAGAVVRAGSR